VPAAASSRPCVIPVARPQALAWLAGQLNDTDLLLDTPLRPEGIFVADLPNRAAYRQMLLQLLYWRRQGARFVIFRTGNPVVDDHYHKNGSRETYRENFLGKDSQYRFLLPPKAFDAWLNKFSRILTPKTALPAGTACQPRRCEIQDGRFTPMSA
jgi:hypothetical protein